MERRKMYEQRAEIQTKKLLSQIYALEAKALEARQSAQKQVQKVNEQVGWDDYLNKLAKERENLNKKYRELIKASGKNWNELYIQFGEYTDRINELRQDYAQRSSDWLQSLRDRASHLEDMATQSGSSIGSYFNTQLTNLKDQVDNLEQRWSGFQNSTGKQWQDLRNEIDQELQTARTTLYNLYGHFRGGSKKEKPPQAEQEG